MVPVRLKAFVRRCIGKIGCLLRHPIIIKVLVIIFTTVLTLLLRILIVVLLTTAGLTLPIG